MASETPGGAAHSRRRKLSWQDDRSTDKTYRSGDISALGGQSAADTIGRPGQLPAAVPTPVARADDKSADKYYASGGSARAGVAGAKRLGPPPALGVRAKPSPADNRLLVATKDDVAPVVAAAASLAKVGQVALVYVKAGDNALMLRTRTAIDLLATRAELTEDQARDIRLAYEPSVSAPPALPPVVPVETNPTEDPLEFLNGDAPDLEDPLVDTSPVVPVEAAVTPTEPAAADDGADNDFLNAQAPAESPAEPPAEAPAEPADQPAQAQGNRRKRR